ncbi:fructosamine kinase family protein [Grimontia hollisae]|uniref:Fructosamine kinase family protein n=2 Tax=Grimontia hollisae TaxID=673 RepID=D0IAP9_GRIHO|nr:fructosamine kinase family protein [Grimontia hollisae]AMG31928.1 fructosamine kinase family protein [Grimontia hollisae]EEY70967.1 fructosamine kinase family protein [Grimontia hollisae CIP 101886]STO44442.1 Fructosamine-3-kinase [Grimontia hollisae]STO57366.1 Fructosamine-3-kinase [Grimontia hollisae]
MWHSLSVQLSLTLGQRFEVEEKTPIDGGDINECYSIAYGNMRFFVKINSRDNLPVFEAEAESLRHLANSGEVSIPQVVYIGIIKEKSVLVLNFIPMKPLDDENAYLLGKELANLHKWGEQLEYGFDIDNFIGTTEQRNSWHRKWANFFADHRIGFQLKLAEERGMSFGDVERIVNEVKERLNGHQPKASLLHGDLWKGNASSTMSGPIIYDPACYWGDREVDIAMTHLFGGFPESFYKGYEEVWPLDPGFEKRKDIYNLYHMLNHCLLFGGPYLTETEALINKLELN